METSPDTKNGTSDPEQLMFWSAAHPAKHSVAPVSEQDWQTLVATSRSSMLEWLTTLSQDGSSMKMSPDCCPVTEDGIFQPSSKRWQTSGMACAGECWTLNTSVSRSVAVESTLSGILETGDLPQRFYLSPIACAGILRRATAKGKKLPLLLERALTRVAGGMEDK